MSKHPIQEPFLGPRDNSWSESERIMLMEGLARGESFNQIATDISAALRYRSELGCKREFYHIRRALRSAE